MKDLGDFHPEILDALEMSLGDYTLYSPPPPAGGAILSFILNVLRGEDLAWDGVQGFWELQDQPRPSPFLPQIKQTGAWEGRARGSQSWPLAAGR